MSEVDIEDYCFQDVLETEKYQFYRGGILMQTLKDFLDHNELPVTIKRNGSGPAILITHVGKDNAFAKSLATDREFLMNLRSRAHYEIYIPPKPKKKVAMYASLAEAPYFSGEDIGWKTLGIFYDNDAQFMKRNPSLRTFMRLDHTEIEVDRE